MNDAPVTVAPARGIAARMANTDDTAWMLASTALVLMMTIPGLALFYTGMVRKKNVLATLKSFAIACLVTIVWMVVGYSIAFTNGNAYVGGLTRALSMASRIRLQREPTKRSLGAGTDTGGSRTARQATYGRDVACRIELNFRGTYQELDGPSYE